LIIGTIRENLICANKDALEADIKEALTLAHADFVYSLEDGIDTYVGSSTVQNLSGG